MERPEPEVKLIEQVPDRDVQGLISWEEDGELFVEGFPSGGGYERRWVCDPPSEELRYQVLREAWSDDFKVRTIYEIELVS